MAPVVAVPPSPPKVLVIGSAGHAHVQCIDWAQLHDVNLVDYDAIVVNVRSLAPDVLLKLRTGYFDAVRTGLTRLLESKGELIVLCEKAQRTRVSKDTSVSNYAWCPIGVGTHAEAGDTVNIMDKRFGKLLAHLKDWDFYFFIPSGCLTQELINRCGDTYNHTYKVPIEPLATNRYGQPLAGRTVLSVRSNRDDTNFSLGPITLLPPIRSLDDRAAVNLILEDLLGQQQTTLPPAWAEKIDMPGSRQLKNEIATRKKQIAVIDEEIAQYGRRIAELEEVKILIYGSGVELEQTFSKCLEKLGAKIGPARYSQEEFVVEYDGELGLVECKGVGKSIALAHVRQLMDYMDKYDEDAKKKGKGILLGNAWRDIPLNERVDVAFPDNVVSRGNDLGMALVDSAAFFGAYCKFLEGKLTDDHILRQIFATKGIVSF